jgi:transcriptional regulator with XRE-family HTH domain
MSLGARLRLLRERKRLSQSDIVRKTGVSWFFVVRVENGHAMPSIETLEKWASALNVPVHRLFYEEEASPALLNLSDRLGMEEIVRSFLDKLFNSAGKTG